MPQVSDVIQKTLAYDKIKIKLASPSKIREWSRGVLSVTAVALK